MRTPILQDAMEAVAWRGGGFVVMKGIMGFAAWQENRQLQNK